MHPARNESGFAQSASENRRIQMGTRKKKGLAIELDDLGRPARPTVLDPRKFGSNRLGQRLQPQLPSVTPSKIRHTAGTARGSQ
jgi:hypothetical protein